MYLNPIKNIAKASFALAVALAAMAPTTEAQAQDLIARQAPIDRKMKTVDSLVINKAVKKQQKVQQHEQINFEQTDLYTTWETKSVHCYAGQTPPNHYRIDLRGFAMPTPSKIVTSNYGYRASFGRMHKGLDIKVYIGDTIVSAFDGKVRIVNYEAKGYGNYVVVRHNNGLETIYGHLSKHLCKVGDVVRAGQPIGLGGNTGRSTGSHLHFETRILGEAINPALLFDFVHQDVTGDFYDYRRSGASAASTKGSTASVSKAKKSSANPATSAPTKPVTAPTPTKTASAPKQDAAPAPASQAKSKKKAASNQPAGAQSAGNGKKEGATSTQTNSAKATPSKAVASRDAKAAAPAAKAPAKVQTKAATEVAPAAKDQGKAAAQSAPAAKGQGKAAAQSAPAAKGQGKAAAQSAPAAKGQGKAAAQSAPAAKGQGKAAAQSAPAAKGQGKAAAQSAPAKSQKVSQSVAKSKATATATQKTKTNGQVKKA